MKKLLTSIVIILTIYSGAGAQNYQADFNATKACVGQPTLLTDASYAQPPDSIVSWSWDLNGDLIFDDTTGPVISYVFLNPANPSLPDSFNVGLKIETKFHIIKSTYKQIRTSTVKADFTYSGECMNDSTFFTNESFALNTNISDYTWYFDNTLNYQSSELNPIFIYDAWGDYEVSLVVLTSNGCYDSIMHPLHINPSPEFDLQYSMEPSGYNMMMEPMFSFYDGQVLEVNVDILSGNYSSIEWYLKGNIIPDFSGKQRVSVMEAGEYMVTVVDDYHCSSMMAFYVSTIFDNEINPMTLITPNGDGKNDLWYIKPVLLPDDSYDLTIFNRWGDEVYSQTNYQNDWDGTYEGNPLPEGTYYYIITDRNDQVFKGAVNILR